MTDPTHSTIVQAGVFAADMWAAERHPWRGTQAEFTRGLVETAVLHLIEQGLLVVPGDIEERLNKPIKVRRETAGG